MTKKFSLATMEMAESAVKDAPNFGLSAKIEQADGEISVAYDSCSDCGEKKSLSMEDVYSAMRSVSNEFSYEVKWIREEVKYLHDRFNEHTKGHLPAIRDGSKMEGALKALGIGDSFSVGKPTVWVEY